MTLATGSFDGLRMLSITVVSAFDSFTTQYMAYDWKDDQERSGVQIINASFATNFSIEPTAFNPDFSTHYFTASECMEMFEEIVIPFIVQIYEEWGTGTAGDPVLVTASGAGGDQLSGLMLLPVMDESGAQVLMVRVSTHTQTAIGIPSGVTGAVTPYPMQPVSISSGASAQLAEIVEVLKDIATNDPNVSVNQGRAMFSAGSGVGTGP